VKILALETTGLSGGIAALEGDVLLNSLDLTTGQRSAQSLAPGIAELLRRVGWTVRDVELIAVTAGPGSFTGVRVGVTTAKTLAYATGAAVLGVDTLEVMAAQSPLGEREIWSVFDAQRGEWFAAKYARQSESDSLVLRLAVPHAIVGGAAWLGSLPEGSFITGQGLAKLRSPAPANVRLAEPPLWQPRAETVGRLACRKHQAGERGDLWALVPNYLRVSAAEEKLARATPAADPN
jgi:tRNA threonylcarbamoyladenosine biosynthesis protein TsaB